MHKMNHRLLASLVIVYVLVFAFVFTVIITCLSLIGWVAFSKVGQQDKLFYVLIVELVVIAIAFFRGFLAPPPRPSVVFSPSADYPREFTEMVEAFRGAEHMEEIEDLADNLGKAAERTRNAAVDVLLYRLRDDPVQEEPDVEDAVCRALVRLGVMQDRGNLTFSLVPDEFLSHAMRQVVKKHSMTIPMRYRRMD